MFSKYFYKLNSIEFPDRIVKHRLLPTFLYRIRGNFKKISEQRVRAFNALTDYIAIAIGCG